VELLWRMAHIYRVPMKFFFEGLDESLYREYVDDSYLNNIYSAESFDLMYATIVFQTGKWHEKYLIWFKV